jgi:hypothetical protein
MENSSKKQVSDVVYIPSLSENYMVQIYILSCQDDTKYLNAVN